MYNASLKIAAHMGNLTRCGYSLKNIAEQIEVCETSPGLNMAVADTHAVNIMFNEKMMGLVDIGQCSQENRVYIATNVIDSIPHIC